MYWVEYVLCCSEIAETEDDNILEVGGPTVTTRETGRKQFAFETAQNGVRDGSAFYQGVQFLANPHVFPAGADDMRHVLIRAHFDASSGAFSARIIHE